MLGAQRTGLLVLLRNLVAAYIRSESRGRDAIDVEVLLIMEEYLRESKRFDDLLEPCAVN